MSLLQFITWSVACIEKLNVINSQIGSKPAIAANPISVIMKPKILVMIFQPNHFCVVMHI
jgi:hypothetical protein